VSELVGENHPQHTAHTHTQTIIRNS